MSIGQEGVSAPAEVPVEESFEIPEPRSPGPSPIEVAGDVIPPKRIDGESRWRSPPRNCRWSGLAIVQGVVDAEGRLGELQFLKNEPPACFREWLSEDLATWRFEPARREGEPVAVYYRLTVRLHPR